MRQFNAEETAALLDDRALIDALRAAFTEGFVSPPRSHLTVDPAAPGEPASTLLMMPAWKAGEALGVKLVTVTPAAGAKGMPVIAGVYVLFDADGRPVALFDGAALTARRTACVSALASGVLAPAGARIHLMVGAGALAAPLARAHRAATPIETTLVWARRPAAAETLAEVLRAEGVQAAAVTDLEAAVRTADIVTCATLASEPLIRGAWLKPASHLDLVGAFRPDMREADNAALQGAEIWVDTLTALTESGELAIPIASGALRAEDVRGDLAALLAAGPRRAGGRTVYKAVGTAVADFAAARLAWRSQPAI